MSVHVLLGGNGYIGREVTRQWLAIDPAATFVVVSSSGKNQLVSDRITNVVADATDYHALAEALPERFDTIVDFLGRPANNDTDNSKINIAPARAMKQLAEERDAQAMGFIGGKLGPKSFTQTKNQLVTELQDSTVPLAVVEPTIVYGAGRDDLLSKMVPVFKLLGLVSKNFKPVEVSQVAQELVGKLRQHYA